MISEELIKEIATKAQTSTINIVREYIQNLFLSFLYRHPESGKVLFKGGTALRLIYRSPRFSEDLDFDGVFLPIKTIEDVILETLKEVEVAGIAGEIIEATETSGGYLGMFIYRFYGKEVGIKFEVSLRKQHKIAPEITLIENDFVPSYTIFQLPQNDLINEKIKALLERGKPRDYFDFYFLLRANMLPLEAKKKLNMVREKTERTKIDFKDELEEFLPRSHYKVIKSLKQNILKELERYKI